MQGLWQGLCKDSQGFVRLWERIYKDSCKTLGEDLQGFARDFGRGFARIHEARLWERICKDFQGFVRLWEKIRKDS